MQRLTVYYAGIPNFGDRLSPVLLARFAGVRADRQAPARAELFCVGSVLQKAPPTTRATILGTGFMYEHNKSDLRHARVLAVRGPLTAARIKAEPRFLGDPGILVDLLVQDLPDPDTDLGWIPHRVDKRDLPGRRIDLEWPIERVITEAARCERIVTSSLHGLILADALERPRKLEPHPGVLGGLFKFRDYSSALGIGIEPGTFQAAPALARERMRSDLLEGFRCVTSS